MPDISMLIGNIGGIVVFIGGLLSGLFWLSNVNAKINEAQKNIETLNSEMLDIEARMKAMEDHKVSVAILMTQMGMVLDRITELGRDVKNLLDGHARLTSRDDH
jgi:outer membrane murein-binding lipoprotein Lpp